MLRELHISGLGVIDDLDLPLHAGLNVLTGETGAGKTMVTVGLALALGARASAIARPRGSAGRRGCRRSSSARRADADAAPSMPASGPTTTSCSWRRSGPGRRQGHVRGSADSSRPPPPWPPSARISSRSTVSTRPSVCSTSGTQTAFLDRFAGDATTCRPSSPTDEAFDELRALRSELDALRDASRDRERELDLLAYQVREIEAVRSAAGRDAGAARRGGAAGARRAPARARAQSPRRRWTATTAQPPSPRWPRRRAPRTRPATLDPEVDRARRRAPADWRPRSPSSPATFGPTGTPCRRPGAPPAVRERIAALRSLQRKYGETDDDVRRVPGGGLGAARRARGADERLGELADAGDERGGQVAAERPRSSARPRRSAPARSRDGDRVRAPGSSACRAPRSRSTLDPLERAGPERGRARRAAVREPARGSPRHRSAKTASGGELSRTMLACRSVLADLDEVPTLVFDEVDAGIGGRAGLAVGRRLARLARDRQVRRGDPPAADRLLRRPARAGHQAGGTAAIEVLDDDGAGGRALPHARRARPRARAPSPTPRSCSSEAARVPADRRPQ